MMEMGLECPWRNTEGFHCDQEASVNTTFPGNVRWQDMACDCAWWDFTNEWRQVSKEEVTISFSDSAAVFFEAGEGKWECDDVKIGCDQMGMQCMDSQVSNTTGPAGALIMASFAHTSHHMYQLYDAVKNGETETRGEMLDFYDTFVEVNIHDSDRNFFLSVDIIEMFFSVFSAPFFNNLMNGNRKSDNTKDVTHNMTGWAGNCISDAAEFDQSGNIDTLTVSGDLSTITTGWRQSIAQLNKELFSGEGEGFTYFWEIIKDGKRVKQGRIKGDLGGDWRDRERRRLWAEKVIYAMMIPTAWYAGGRSPVVLDTGRHCDDAGYLNREKMSSKTEKTARVCHNERLYYLVAPTFELEREYISPSNCFPGNPGGPYVCFTPGREPKNLFTPLPGSAELKATSNRWGDITLGDMVVGSLNTYDANGNKNGAGALDVKNKDEFEKLYDNSDEPVDLRAPGLFRIPVCSPDEAYSVWEESKDGKSNENARYVDRRYWPCKKP